MYRMEKNDGVKSVDIESNVLWFSQRVLSMDQESINKYEMKIKQRN